MQKLRYRFSLHKFSDNESINKFYNPLNQGSPNSLTITFT
jgi:hypothetical protein